MAEQQSSRVRRWVILAILAFPYTFLLGMIPLFEHCAAEDPR